MRRNEEAREGKTNQKKIIPRRTSGRYEKSYRILLPGVKRKYDRNVPD
jgi:hypothetical protein